MGQEEGQMNKGLTLIEVMVTLLVAMIIGIAAMSFMYACALHAHEADVRITSVRIGQLLLDGWKITGNVDNSGAWDVLAFNPTSDSFDTSLPAPFSTTSYGVTGLENELGRYSIKIDGVYYFATLSYENDNPDSAYLIPLYRLNANVAWNQNLSSSDLETNYKSIDITSYAIY
jgi:Tfp pilus assembly protein PilV